MNAIGRLGIATNSPLNRLQITSEIGDPQFGNPEGSSGLRFTNLTSGNTPLTNPGQGVLSVNSSGDVIYVNGTSCEWNEISTNNLATGYAGACHPGNVSIGTSTILPTAKLAVENTGASVIGVYAKANGSSSSYGGAFIGEGTGQSVGVQGIALTGTTCYGVRGATSNNGTFNAAIHGTAPTSIIPVTTWAG